MTMLEKKSHSHAIKERRVDTILITNCPRMFYENVIRLLSNICIALQVQRPIERDFMAEKYTQ